MTEKDKQVYTYEQGYKQALEDIKILVEAVNLLEDFGGTVGGSSSFWEDVYSEDYWCKVHDALNIITLGLKGETQ